MIFLIADVVPWFENAGLVGGLLGASIGVIGGGLGSAIGICAPRGIGKKIIVPIHLLFVVASIGLLGAGLFGLMTGQPYGVWYSLVLPGFIGTTVLGCLFPVVLMRYRQAEARHLEAEEFRNA